MSFQPRARSVDKASSQTAHESAVSSRWPSLASLLSDPSAPASAACAEDQRPRRRSPAWARRAHRCRAILPISLTRESPLPLPFTDTYLAGVLQLKHHHQP